MVVVAELPRPGAGCASCAAREKVIAELGRVVEELRAEVAELRRLGRNSRNSSMPPSTDDLTGRQPPRRERRDRGAGRKRGKQPGAPGAAMSWAQPEEVVDHHPSGACDDCGTDLTQAAGLAAVTERYSLFFLEARTLESFREFGILPDFAGVVVSDRYQNYFHHGWEHITGHQACCPHLVRDFEDAAECWPGAARPVQAQRALRGLIRAWHSAREQGQPEIPPPICGPLIREFRHAVLAGCSDVPRPPAPKHVTARHPGRDLL